jgi:hypothetical protein
MIKRIQGMANDLRLVRNGKGVLKRRNLLGEKTPLNAGF